MAGMTTEQILTERQSTHGEYSEHARATQNILRVLQKERNWPTLSDMQKETLHMIAHKMGRIVTGNPDVADHWDDIAGYSALISQRLAKPITPVSIEDDPYMAFALAWNISREDAKMQLLALLDMRRGNGSVSDDLKKQVDDAEVEISEEDLGIKDPAPSFYKTDSY